MSANRESVTAGSHVAIQTPQRKAMREYVAEHRRTAAVAQRRDIPQDTAQVASHAAPKPSVGGLQLGAGLQGQQFGMASHAVPKSAMLGLGRGAGQVQQLGMTPRTAAGIGVAAPKIGSIGLSAPKAHGTRPVPKLNSAPPASVQSTGQGSAQGSAQRTVFFEPTKKCKYCPKQIVVHDCCTSCLRTIEILAEFKGGKYRELYTTLKTRRIQYRVRHWQRNVERVLEEADFRYACMCDGPNTYKEMMQERAEAYSAVTQLGNINAYNAYNAYNAKRTALILKYRDSTLTA
jgi:hypothetical protein